MKWTVIVLLFAVLPTIVANSGTFVEDFSDQNLDEWIITGFPGPVFPDRVRVKYEYLVMDAVTVGAHAPIAHVYMQLRTGDSKKWDSYTLTCRVRFDEIPHPGGIPGEFSVLVRHGPGRFSAWASHEMLIYPTRQRIQVTTVPPHAKDHPATRVKGEIHRQTLKGRDLRRRIEVGQWISIKVVAEKDRFEFHFDGNFVTRYVDDTTVPGTVSFSVWGGDGLVVNLDDVTITGVGVPRSVNYKSHLATTWGEVKNSLRK